MPDRTKAMVLLVRQATLSKPRTRHGIFLRGQPICEHELKEVIHHELLISIQRFSEELKKGPAVGAAGPQAPCT
jgi:hypothetical protein